jgi:FkbM family methyltransferase
MIVNTQRLFTRLMRATRVDVVCDVGSMNGADALRFYHAAPRSRVYALEPNPVNFDLMRANQALQADAFRLLPLAASNCDGESDFFLVDADHSRGDASRGLSSLYQRSGPMYPSTGVARVRTARLDSLLASECASGARVALWIDVEGKAYEVIEGMSGVAAHVCLLHIEVESAPCIASEQRLYPEVAMLLQRLGFAELATDLPAGRPQFNALFVRRGLPARTRLSVCAALLYERTRYLAASLLRKLCPACMRRYQSARAARRAQSAGMT